MTRRTDATSKVVGFIATFGFVFLAPNAISSVASADPLGAGDGAIYRLNPESSFEEGCFPPCMCPIMVQDRVRGTFKLAYAGQDEEGIHTYSVADVNWTVPLNFPELHILGTGKYQMGSPGVLPVIQHRMQLDLQIDDRPREHFDSGWIPVEQAAGITITVSINGMYCWDIAITINASAVPDSEIHPYALLRDSTFQRGCWDPCDCLLGPELPMFGTFNLVPVAEEPLALIEFGIVDVDWHVLASSAGESIPITGFGVYQILGDFVAQHRLALELVVGNEERTHFDSGVLNGGSFPLIDAVVSINGIWCYDTVLNVQAGPVEGTRCGGIAGIPCDDGYFCKLRVGECCCDQFGVCTPIPGGCPDVWEPVCGCDGNTYGNECEADAAGVSIDHFGECRQACISTADCSANDHFCKFPEGTCGDATVPGVCTLIPDACPEIYDPVCGCDGVTYNNECFADAAAVSVAHRGECVTTDCAATRILSAPDDLSYCPGVAKTVRIVLNPPNGTSAIGLEDSPPAGWVVSNISNGGIFDTVNWKVKWGPLFPPFPAEVTYEATPTNASGVVCFTGIISIDGVNETTCGDECIDVCCPYIPADTPQAECPDCPVSGCNTCDASSCHDAQVSMCELVGYACAWMAGCNDDLSGMTRAAYLWRNGECYCWDDLERNWFPASCTADSVCCNRVDPAPPAASGGSTSGSATARVRPVRSGQHSGIAKLRVPITVEAPAGTSAMGLECEVPRGWRVFDVSDGGTWDRLHRKVKWGPFMDNLSRTVRFTVRRRVVMPISEVTPLRGEKRPGGMAERELAADVRLKGLSGTVSFDGINQSITIEQRPTHD